MKARDLRGGETIVHADARDGRAQVIEVDVMSKKVEVLCRWIGEGGSRSGWLRFRPGETVEVVTVGCLHMAVEVRGTAERGARVCLDCGAVVERWPL